MSHSSNLALPRSFLSVGIPAYNQGTYLRTTIDSLLHQNVSPLEIIVSDNHSTDETAHVLKDYYGRVTVVRPPVHLPMMEHWNFLAKRLQGEWFTLLSSDDRALPNYVQTLQDATKLSQDAVLVRAAFETIDSRGNKTGEQHLLSAPTVQVPSQTFIHQLTGAKGGFAAFAVRNASFRTVGGFPLLNYTGDWGLWLRLSHLGNFAYVDETVSQYRNDYRAEIKKGRLVAWLQDSVDVCTKLIPRLAANHPSVSARKLRRASVTRFMSELDAAHQLLDSSDGVIRARVADVVEAWAREIGAAQDLQRFREGRWRSPWMTRLRPMVRRYFGAVRRVVHG